MEAKREVERQRLQQQQCQESLFEREREAVELERQVAELPAVEWLADLQMRLDEETLQRQRCQTELLDLRGRPRLFCVLHAGSEPLEECGLTRSSRSEVSVPSLRQSFEFDFVLEPGNAVCGSDPWTEAKPVLDSALRSPGSYACVFLASSAILSSLGNQELLKRMVDHLFDCATDASKPGEGSVEVSMSMVELGPDNTGFFDLLQAGAPERQVAPKLIEDNSDGSMAVQDLSVLSLHTRDEVVSAHAAGTGRRPRHGHSILTICIQRQDAASQELQRVGGLVVVEMGSLLDGTCGSSTLAVPDTRAGFGRQVSVLTKIAQASMERVGEMHGAVARHVPPQSLPTQAKMLVLATVSPHLCHLQDSLAVLQFSAAVAALQEKQTCKPDDYNCRRQIAKLLQENQRLRTELAERGRVPSQAEATAPEPAEGSAQEAEMASPSPGVGRAVASATPNIRSPRDRERDTLRDTRRAAAAAPTPLRNCRPKESPVPDQKRRVCGTSSSLPVR